MKNGKTKKKNLQYQENQKEHLLPNKILKVKKKYHFMIKNFQNL